MKRCVEILAITAAVALAFTPSVPAQTPAPVKTTDDLIKMFFIPVHEPTDGVNFPYLEDGRLQRLRVEHLERTDTEHVELHNAKITTYDENESIDMTLLLPFAIFNLKTHLVTTDKPFILKRSDFELMGQTLELDPKTRQATITGKVTMIIYNIQPPAPKADEPAKQDSTTHE